MKNSFTNDQESNVQKSADRGSFQTIRSSSAQDDLQEKVPLMENELINQTSNGRQTRHLRSICLHIAIFLIYSIIVFIALDRRSNAWQQNRSLLYCKIPAKLDYLKVDGNTQIPQHQQMKPYDGNCTSSIMEMGILVTHFRAIHGRNLKKHGMDYLEV
jgi:hypothetical protein